jgi:hypothetical protein
LHIQGRGDSSCPGYRVFEGFHDFVQACGDDYLFWSEEHSPYPVAETVHIYQTAVFAYGVCAGQKGIAQQGLAHSLEPFFPGGRGVSVDDPET